jgi:DNA mismatch repair protein MutS2
MPYAVGDQVHLAGIGTGVVREVRKGGRYAVVVKSTTVVVTAAQLAPAEPQKRRRPTRETTPQPTAARPLRAHVASSIDLHGRTALEAEAAIDEFVNEALLGGLATVRVIHGRSGGRVKQAVHARLGQLSSVRAFRVDPTNPGVTIIEL